MRRFSLAAVSLIFAVTFAVSASAQTGAAQTGTGKVGLVNSILFGEDKAGAGITKYKNAIGALEAEFKPTFDELKTMQTRYTSLAAEIQKLQAVPQADPKAIQTKADEYQQLEISMKRKQEDAKVRYERRSGEVIGPVYNDIIKAMNDYAKAKGFAVILDGPKLEEAGILMGFDDKFDITKDFITFYNARPAGAATATPR